MIRPILIALQIVYMGALATITTVIATDLVRDTLEARRRRKMRSKLTILPGGKK